MAPAGTGINFVIPNTLRSWPWPRFCNVHYEECKAESSAWCERFGAFSPKAQKAFNRCDFNLLASLAFAKLNREGCRIGCDLMNLFFVIDEYSDVADGQLARVYADIIMDAIRNPHKPRPEGEWVGGEVARQFWENAVRTATPSAQRRFVHNFGLYMDGVVEQALDREDHRIDSVKTYFDVRRDTIGAKPSFAINEVHMNITDEEMAHPIIKTLTWTCIDMLIIGNDLCSYNVEQSRGDDRHNIVTIVMNEQQIGLHAALQWISDLHDSLAEEFLTAYAKLQTAGFSADLITYADDLGNWVRANDKWSFESERYFGKHGVEIEKTRITELLAKEESGEAGNTGLVPAAK
ncbi:terpenoid synthase [Moniliophthora roreri MCA 2997]|uniref:Terpene synthase n=1 Tax=Moniliophthora roreri (strain MCA 2997) TaxID=1381753 RepID=V2WU62_MONRO|nr:terpenoid synthase [Moniliophthora roreri MCA 2997]